MPRRRTTTHRIGLHGPLARWGFTVCAVFALLNNLLWPGLIATAIALYAWRNR
ncbi:hypothetical protein OG352_06240 [Streptomyces sp. NBC_01485]|uniref:hypothetical protein n=1 Tax=Streptomyces sp. NBC_01485 TaxID=2903884 RepID=UPI002E3112E4|nr:hypothetical protein [Streptomyces sp. NBC_01485]